jgi:hypothetical protein
LANTTNKEETAAFVFSPPGRFLEGTQKEKGKENPRCYWGTPKGGAGIAIYVFLLIN